jgi:hypothetical protein
MAERAGLTLDGATPEKSASMTDRDWPRVIAAYYRSPGVRARIAEYCGGHRDAPASFSCFSLGAYGGERDRREPDGAPVPCPNADLEFVFEEGADVCRSLADRQGTLLQLDVDYVSPRDPAHPYSNPETAFRRLEPVHQALREMFASYGIRPRVIATGRGYHFTVRAPFDSPFQASLVAIATVGEAAVARCARCTGEPGAARRLALGHEGAGRVLEHLVHGALHRLRGRTEVPVTLADVPPPDGGPFICLDLTAYADPLFERHVRCAFSTNQKSGVQSAAPARPFVVTLPRGQLSLDAFLRYREDPEAAARYASDARVAIPDAPFAVDLVEDYRRGPVGRFHAEFDRGPELDPAQWPFTYDTLTASGLPACLAAPLEFPNPLLLRPPCLRTIALGLWAMGFHPRSIAGLVRSRYERNHGWRPPFIRYDAESRALFYVRLLCGAVADGLDGGSDFTCEIQERRGLCEPWRCPEEQRQVFASLQNALVRKGGR